MAAKLQVELAVIDRATKELNGIAREFNTFQNKIMAVGQAVSKIFVGGMITGLLVNEFKKAMNASIEYGWETERTSKITELNTNEVQRLDYILNQAGSSMDAMKRPLQMLSKLAFANSTAFKALGIDIKDEYGNLKSAGAIFEEAIVKLGEVSNTTERAAIAHKLFGRGAAGVLSIIATGTENIKRYADETVKYGLILSNQTIKALEEAKKSTLLFDKSMQVLSANMVVEFTPALRELARFGSEAVLILRNIAIPIEYYLKIANRENIITAAKDIQIERTIEQAKKENDLNSLFLLRGETLKKIQVIEDETKKLNDQGATKGKKWQDEDLKKITELKKEAKAYALAIQEINDTNNPKNKKSMFDPNDFKDQKEHIQSWEEFQQEQEKFRIEDEKKRIEYQEKVGQEEDKIIDENVNNKWNRYKAENEAVSALWKEQEDLKRRHDQAMVDAAMQWGKAYGAAIGQGIGKGKEGVRAAMKGILCLTVDFLEKEVLAAVASNTLQNVEALGVWGLLSGAAEAAGIVAVAEAAKGAINSFAIGTHYAPGGMAMVGEHGPETMFVPRGAQIYNATETKNINRINNNSGYTFNIVLNDASGNMLESMTTQIRSGTANVDRFIGALMQRARVG